jgi:hypothetical protein
MRRVTVSAAALALCLTATAWADGEISRTTPAGKEVLVRDHTEVTTSCTGSMPVIDITHPPAHGKVDVRPAHFVFRAGSGYAAVKSCEGRDVDGGGVWYTPQAGFKGVDDFSYTVDHGAGKHRQTDTWNAHITVQ